MKSQLFYNYLALRITGPFFLGIFIYLLVLMVFDNLAGLGEYFFNQEAFLCIAITYFFSENQRLVNNGFLPKLERTPALKSWLLLLLVSGLSLTVVLVSLIVSGYFIFGIGYSWGTFFTELNAFIWIYCFIYVLYFMVLSSVVLFRIENKRALEKESVLKKNIDLKLQIFSRVINPEFLYKSLEALIMIIHRKDKASENFIQKLSHVYRSVLDSRHEELSDISSELEIAESALYLYNQQFGNCIKWTSPLQKKSADSAAEAYLLPGSMMIVLEWIVNSSIIQPNRPLEINIWPEEDYLVVEYSLWERLMPGTHYREKLKELETSFVHFTQRPFLIVKAEDRAFIKMPLLLLEPAA